MRILSHEHPTQQVGAYLQGSGRLGSLAQGNQNSVRLPPVFRVILLFSLVELLCENTRRVSMKDTQITQTDFRQAPAHSLTLGTRFKPAAASLQNISTADRRSVVEAVTTVT